MEFLQEIVLRDVIFFLKGLVVGVAVAAPIGPASIMCIRRTLNHGTVVGLASGLGIALADTFYGCIAGFGMTSLDEFIVEWFTKLRFIGGISLIILGVVFYVLKPPATTKRRNIEGVFQACISGFGVTLANPLILILFAVVFTALGLDQFSKDIDLVGFLILGIFSGSMLWWIALCGVLGIFHANSHVATMTWTNKLSGIMIALLGIYTIYGMF